MKKRINIRSCSAILSAKVAQNHILMQETLADLDSYNTLRSMDLVLDETTLSDPTSVLPSGGKAQKTMVIT